MLISFKFDNFKSFKEKAVLSLVANKSDKTLLGATIDLSKYGVKYKLLSAAAIYGSNAAGKTNVLLALDYMRDAVVMSQAYWKPGAGTVCDRHAGAAKGTSHFEVEVFVEGTRYRYGFELYETHFSREWLYAYPVGRERSLFERTTVGEAGSYVTTVKYGESLTGDVRDHESITRRTRENSLFLSVAAKDNQSEAKIIFDWFDDRLTMNSLPAISDNSERGRTSLMCAGHDDFKSLALSLMRLADSHIVDIIIAEADLSKTKEMMASLPSSVREMYLQSARYNVEFVIKSGRKKFNLPLSAQSRGVKRMYALASDIIFALRFGETLVIDELEGSMHPHVASTVLSFFQTSNANDVGSQIIFTTHDTNLLNMDSLRRDQIWFVEKENAQSHLYPLLKFQPRKDENLEMGYLRGRYGGIPATGMDPRWFQGIAELSDEPR